jgi:small multidrug resistance family-3 protein
VVETTVIVPESDATLFVIVSIAIFFLAALVEIGGGYLVWKWLRERKGILCGIVGGIVCLSME